MKYAGYVIAGWTVTGGVFAAYWVTLRQRIRRAEASAPADDRGPV